MSGIQNMFCFINMWKLFVQKYRVVFFQTSLFAFIKRFFNS